MFIRLSALHVTNLWQAMQILDRVSEDKSRIPVSRTLKSTERAIWTAITIKCGYGCRW